MKRITVLSAAALVLAATAFNLTCATEASAYGWNSRMSDDWDRDSGGGGQSGRMSPDRWGDSLFDERGGYGDGYGRGHRRHSDERMGWGSPCSSRFDSARAGELWHDRMLNADDQQADSAARRARIRQILAESLGMGDDGSPYGNDQDAHASDIGGSDVRDLILYRIRNSGDFDQILDNVRDRIAGDDE